MSISRQWCRRLLLNLRHISISSIFQIDQPIPLADLNSIIFNTEGVLAVMNLKLISLTGDYKGRSYSDIDFDPTEHTIKGLIVGPPGSIFEVSLS